MNYSLDFVFVEEHVRNARLDLVDALAVGTGQAALQHLPLEQQQVQVSQELLVLQHRLLKLLGQVNTPVELAHSLAQGTPFQLLCQLGHQGPCAGHGRVIVEVRPARHGEVEREVDDAGRLAGALVAHEQVLRDQSHLCSVLFSGCCCCSNKMIIYN